MDLNLSGVLIAAITLAGAILTAAITLRKVKADRENMLTQASDNFRDQLVEQLSAMRSELHSLRTQVVEYRTMETRLREELHSLERENEGLRRRIRVLEQKLAGVSRYSGGQESEQ